jgi:methyl coenzyme M reductase alpha subunit
MENKVKMTTNEEFSKALNEYMEEVEKLKQTTQNILDSWKKSTRNWAILSTILSILMYFAGILMGYVLFN